MLAHVQLKGVGEGLSDFAHGVGETFELKSGNLRNCVEVETFACIGADLAVVAEVLVTALELVDCKETGETFMEAVGLLTFLI